MAAAEPALSALVEQGAALCASDGDGGFLRLLEENRALLETSLNGDAGCFPMLILDAAFPALLQIYEQRGIPESILAATLEEFDEKTTEFYEKHGRGGLLRPGWFLGHMQGRLFQIGRLQYMVNQKCGFAHEALAADDNVLQIHVTAKGRLDPEACRKSMDDAVAFAARHFPERDYKAFTLCSWLLDEQLEELLPPGSNIIRFSRLFTRVPGESDAGPVVYNWIFGFDKQQEDYRSHIPQTSLQAGARKLLDEGRWFKNRMGFILI